MSIENRVRSGLLYLKNVCGKENAFQNDKMGSERSSLQVCYHPPENFTSITALDYLGYDLDEETKATIFKFLSPKPGHGLYGSKNMYKMEKLIPDDIELTGLIMWNFLQHGLVENNQQLLDVARLLILNVNKDGIMETYFPPRGKREQRIDEAICCSALRIPYTLGLDNEVMDTENYLYNYLESSEYLNGGRYYFSPDTFPLYLARAVSCSARAKARFANLIYDSIKDRLGTTKFPIDMATRILTLSFIEKLDGEDVKNKVMEEKATLESMQAQDGSFLDDSLYKKGRTDEYFGGRTISTIFGVAALKCFTAMKKLNGKC